MASFNFYQFEAEFRLKQMLRNVARIFSELRNAENERLVPSEPGNSPHELMEQLGVGAEQPAAEFDFELGDVLSPLKRLYKKRE
jgi:hypothetical protein